jgi:hypothetical protein
MFLVGHVDRLVDQQNGDPIVDPVRPTQARVVEHIADMQQGTSVGWADQNAQKFFVEHSDRL